jgi:organic radical activating enzyme
MIKQAYNKGVRNVVWTGGEPGLQIGDVKDVIADVESLGMIHAVETNGTIPFGTTIFDLVVVSPKDREYTTDKSINELLDIWLEDYKKTVVFKPVVDAFNIDWWMKWTQDHMGARIYFMPMTPQDETMIDEHNKMVRLIIRKMEDYGVNAAVSPRLHVLYKVR